MIVKTFKGGRTFGGAKATIQYLLNERTKEGTARLIKGDTDLTESLIKVASRKQKWSWSSGVLSFSELIENKEEISEIIEEFEKTFFCGMKQENYNTLWVLHEDKGRTELHYICPRMELETGLSYNPYFHKRDFKKKDLFQELINLRYGYSSYKDNRAVVKRKPNWSKNAKKADIRKEFDDVLIEMIKDGIINSREEMIYQLQEWGYEVNRTGKEYITIVTEDNKKHRLKGAIYGENFTSWQELERATERERKTVANGVPRELEAIRKELDRIVEQQAYTNKAKYNKKDKVKQPKKPITPPIKSKTKITVPTSSINYIWLDLGRPPKHPIPYTRKKIKQKKEDTKQKNNKGINDDSIRTATIERTRQRTERERARTRSFDEYVQKYEQTTTRDIAIATEATNEQRDSKNTERYIDQLFRYFGRKYQKFQSIFDRGNAEFKSKVIEANAEFGRGLIDILKKRKNSISTTTINQKYLKSKKTIKRKRRNRP